jgi:hypothetical protein
MKILCLAVAVLATSSVAATARNSDHSDLLLGPSHLTCGSFNKLPKRSAPATDQEAARAEVATRLFASAP